MTPERRREAIIDAALVVMTRKGMAGTTVRDVADEMGTSSGLIHHYVTSMDDLLAAAFEQVAGQDLESTRSAMSTGVDPVQRLALFFSAYARADEDWAFQLWLDAWSEAGRRPAVRAVSHRLNVAWQQLLAEAIRDGVAAGRMSCAEPEDTAWRIVSLLDGLSLQAVAHRASIDRESVISWAAAYAESELALERGLLSAPAPAPGASAPVRL
jgi:AcrR family transcriptional regulator